MKNLQLELTLEETNLILESLGQLPFVKVHQLITKIQQQAQGQLNQENGSEAAPTPK